MHSLPKVLFAIERSKYLLDEMADLQFCSDMPAAIGLGKYERKVFPDSEIYHRVPESLNACEAVVIGSLVDGNDDFELQCLVSALHAQGAWKLTLIIPWFGGQTMDRAQKTGEAVTAKVRARMLSALPRFPLGNTIVVMDAHTDALPGFFENDVRALHLWCRDKVIEEIQVAIRDATGEENPEFCLACGDGGRLKWVESYAKVLKVPLAVALKQRHSGTEVERIAVETSLINGLPVVMYDDIARTFGTARQAAEAFKAASAKQLVLVVTHGDFCGFGTTKCALAAMKDAGVFSKIVCTNTHPRAVQIDQDGSYRDYLKVVSIAPVIRGYLRGEVEAF